MRCITPNHISSFLELYSSYMKYIDYYKHAPFIFKIFTSVETSSNSSWYKLVSNFNCSFVCYNSTILFNCWDGYFEGCTKWTFFSKCVSNSFNHIFIQLSHHNIIFCVKMKQMVMIKRRGRVFLATWHCSLTL